MTEQTTVSGGRDIFIVSNSVDEMGGVTTWTHQMAREFTDRGHRVHVIGITPAPAGREHEFPEPLPYATTTLYDTHPPQVRPLRGIRGKLNAVERRRHAARAAGMRRRADRMTALFAAARPGAVLIVTQVWAMEWVALADTKGLLVIGMSHESYAASAATSRLSRVKRHYKDVDRLLILTPGDADRWIRAGMDNVGHMPNALPFMPEVPAPRSEKVVVSIGRLSHEKGVDMLLDSWAEIASRHPAWKLRIYGTGDEEQRLRARTTELGLDGSVEWKGRTNDVLGALSEASVFAQASRAEGFPITLLEAMATGLPCAAFDCAPGVREIIRDGEDGLLARLGNTVELGDHISTLITDEELRNRMGDAAFENVKRYAADEITDRWEALFAFLER
ncbi:glycosyl transferase [Streptomyces vietnamensis]|uniref:D-inositol 3-phosphate glycosyltransferase n=2 Tax=Streptomyces vietnamensis TaxID=362257 RepID=A0A0B5I689_9ACTN|nr:glycosyl transferase [Streptomyces vietnamensis]